MNSVYGFDGEVRAKLNEAATKLFTQVFCALPLGCVLGGKVFVVHGGLFSSDDVKIADLKSINRFREPPDEGPMCEMLWSDPAPTSGRSPSKRGVGVAFGEDVTKAFLERNGLELLVRSHEVKDEGFEVDHGGCCITVFSAPNYCDQMGNKGAFIRFEHDMVPHMTSFAAVVSSGRKPSPPRLIRWGVRSRACVLFLGLPEKKALMKRPVRASSFSASRTRPSARWRTPAASCHSCEPAAACVEMASAGKNSVAADSGHGVPDERKDRLAPGPNLRCGLFYHQAYCNAREGEGLPPAAWPPPARWDLPGGSWLWRRSLAFGNNEQVAPGRHMFMRCLLLHRIAAAASSGTPTATAGIVVKAEEEETVFLRRCFQRRRFDIFWLQIAAARSGAWLPGWLTFGHALLHATSSQAADEFAQELQAEGVATGCRRRLLPPLAGVAGKNPNCSSCTPSATPQPLSDATSKSRLPAGMARSSDPWLAAFEEAKCTADEVLLLLSERDEAMTQGNQEGATMRLTAAARRKWSALGSRIEQLEKALPNGGQCVPADEAMNPLQASSGCSACVNTEASDVRLSF